MKRCPECRRDYYDDTLLYCLDDGNALLEGPASGKSDRAASAGGRFANENPTRPFINTTAAEAEPRGSLGGTSEKPSFSARRAKPLIVLAAAVAVLVGGFFGYRYFSGSSTKQINSIAVMPFVNASGNPDVEYLSDGLTEAVIESLSKLPELSVKSRTSVFRYKGKEIDPRSVGAELNVQAVLSGRMVQRDEKLELRLELVDSRNENVIWSGSFERRMTDIATLQNETAADVSRQLKIQFAGANADKTPGSATENSEAYLVYLKGRFNAAKFTREGLDLGLQHFNEAIAKDPNYANAYAGIAYYNIVSADWFLPSREALPKAKETALKALPLDPGQADAQGSLAITYWWYDWDRDAAEKAFRRSIELDGGNAHKRSFFGWFLVSTGRAEEGLEQNREALKSDPLSPETNMMFGQTLYFARKFSQAEEQLRKTISVDKNFWMGHAMLARTLEQTGRHAEALEEAKTALQLESEVVEVGTLVARIYAELGIRKEARRILAELDELAKKRFIPAYNIAEVYTALVDNNRALEYLEKAYEDRSFYMAMMSTDPVFDGLRSEPRFRALQDKTKL